MRFLELLAENEHLAFHSTKEGKIRVLLIRQIEEVDYTTFKWVTDPDLVGISQIVEELQKSMNEAIAKGEVEIQEQEHKFRIHQTEEIQVNKEEFEPITEINDSLFEDPPPFPRKRMTPKVYNPKFEVDKVTRDYYKDK